MLDKNTKHNYKRLDFSKLTFRTTPIQEHEKHLYDLEEPIPYYVEEERHCTVEQSIKESCAEIKLMLEGVLPKRSWHEFSEKYTK